MPSSPLCTTWLTNTRFADRFARDGDESVSKYDRAIEGLGNKGDTSTMYWAIGYDENWNRDVGFDVPSVCDHPDCKQTINRGIEHVCGGEPYGGDIGCGLYFCHKHLPKKSAASNATPSPLCERCAGHNTPFNPTGDTKEWLTYKQNSNYWAGWRTYHQKK